MGAVAVAAGEPVTGERTVGGAAPAGGFEGSGGGSGVTGVTGAVFSCCYGTPFAAGGGWVCAWATPWGSHATARITRQDREARPRRPPPRHLVAPRTFASRGSIPTILRTPFLAVKGRRPPPHLGA